MATDMFIKIDGIDGESADKGHGKWIDVITFSHGAEQ
nr:type VI secretion system tube protein Hcp [Succinivibrionaceae bacterium]